MKRFFAFLLLLTLILCSCQKKEDLLHYQKYPFEGEFEILQNDGKFTLRISGDAWNEEGERSLVAEFLEPESLKGIKISRESGKTTFSLGGIEFEENGMSPASLCSFARYFELVASPVSFLKEKDVTNARLISNKGEDIRISFSRDGLPINIVGEKITINVLSYKIKN